MNNKMFEEIKNSLGRCAEGEFRCEHLKNKSIFLQKLQMAASEADDMLSSRDASDLLDCLEVSRDYMFDAVFVIQQLEEQLAILKERFELMHKDFRELAARDNAGEDLMACDYCKKNFGECNCNCLKDFKWRGLSGIMEKSSNDD